LTTLNLVDKSSIGSGSCSQLSPPRPTRRPPSPGESGNLHLLSSSVREDARPWTRLQEALQCSTLRSSPHHTPDSSSAASHPGCLLPPQLFVGRERSKRKRSSSSYRQWYLSRGRLQRKARSESVWTLLQHVPSKLRFRTLRSAHCARLRSIGFLERAKSRSSEALCECKRFPTRWQTRNSSIRKRRDLRSD
jgi:hypothetical protein